MSSRNEEILGWLGTLPPGGEFTASDVSVATGSPVNMVARRLKVLAKFGYIEYTGSRAEREGGGRRPRIWRVHEVEE